MKNALSVQKSRKIDELSERSEKYVVEGGDGLIRIKANALLIISPG